MEIKITRKQALPIIKATFPAYRGRKINVTPTNTVSFHDTNWGGGTRAQYTAVQLVGGMARVAKLRPNSPFNNPTEGATVDLPEDVIVVRHLTFCGQDCGLTVYANPSVIFGAFGITTAQLPAGHFALKG